MGNKLKEMKSFCNIKTKPPGLLKAPEVIKKAAKAYMILVSFVITDIVLIY
jgi:hypothetical protein